MFFGESCDVQNTLLSFLQSLKHNPNGRFVVVCGDGEYIIYTALAWRNRSFGSALEFVWSSEGEYAVRESTSKVKIFSKNFQVRFCNLSIISLSLELLLIKERFFKYYNDGLSLIILFLNYNNSVFFFF